MRVIYSHSDETRQLAFNSYRHFLRSIIYYGLDVEKIVALKCILEYCVVERIKTQVRLDTELFKYLKDLRNKLADGIHLDPIESRLRTMIDMFLNEF